MDLRRGSCTRGRQSKTGHGPGQIGIPLATTERQPLTQGWFINLDHAESSAFQVSYLLAERQCNLAARRLMRLIVAHEGPIEHGYRTSQHSLDRVVCHVSKRRRMWRISAVCGNEPSVVVGKQGKLRRSDWICRRSA